jgi:hypothetical protein
MQENKNVYGMSVGKREGKRPLQRPKRGWEDNIKIFIKEISK